MLGINAKPSCHSHPTLQQPLLSTLLLPLPLDWQPVLSQRDECTRLCCPHTTYHHYGNILWGEFESLLTLMFSALQAPAPAHCLSPLPEPWGDRADLWAQKCDAHLCHGMEKMAAAKFNVPLGQPWLFPRQYCCPVAVTDSLPMLSPSLDFHKLGVSLQF